MINENLRPLSDWLPITKRSWIPWLGSARCYPYFRWCLCRSSYLWYRRDRTYHREWRVSCSHHPTAQLKDDLRDFKKLGKPKYFFGVTAGCMDSMVNHYTANKRLRSTDGYTPGGEAGFRPDYATIVYTNILKELYPDVPVLIGGIEASLRRVTHYDYWSDKLMPSILVDSKADMLVYGMGEQPLREILRLVKRACHSHLSKTSIRFLT